MSYLIRNKISLLVCDMAGTIINENGIVYKSIFNTLHKLGYDPQEKNIPKWTGLSKKKVLYDEISKKYINEDATKVINEVNLAENLLLKTLQEEYFYNDGLELIDDELLDFFDYCRINGIHIALNTGYPKTLQDDIIDHLNLRGRIDSSISSDEVKLGRPYPYMINHLLEEFNIISTSNIAKIGDTSNDMLEGKNANCGLTIGVLTGYETKENLLKSGANVVVNKITDLKDDELPIFLL